MTNLNFKSSFLLILAMLFTVIMFSGCSPEYIQNQGIYSYNHEDYLYSAAAFKLVIDQQPDNPNAYYWLGKSYSAGGDYESGISNIKKAIDMWENSKDALSASKSYKLELGQAYFDLANAYYRNDDYQEAANTLNKLNEIDSTKCTANLPTCTEIYDNAGQIKNAVDLQNRHQYSDSDTSKKYRILAYLYLRDHNYDAAINTAAKAIEQKPDNELAYYIIGMASGEKGQYDKAASALRKAIQTQTDNTVSPKKLLPMYASLAYYLTKNGQYDAAITAYNDAIQSTKEKYYFYSYQTMSLGGVPYTASKRLKLSFDDYPSMLAKASCDYNAGKYADALTLLNNYIDKTDTGNTGLLIRDSYYISSMNTLTYVFSVKSGSSAERAGFQFGDKIIAVNGKSVKYKSAKDLASLISGPTGSEVTLKVERINNPLEKVLKKGQKTEKVFLEKTLVRERTADKNSLSELAKAYGVRSLIYRALGQDDKAYDDAQKAMDYNSSSFDAKLSLGLAKLDKGNYVDALKILSNTKSASNERLYSFDVYYFLTPFPSDDELPRLGKAIAYLKLGKINEAISYIPMDKNSNPSSPLWKEYQTLITELNRIAQEHKEKAVKLEQKGFLKEALNEYTLAFNYVGDDNKEEEIRNNLLNLLQEYPAIPTMSEEARKYLIRGEMLFKQGNITGALNECRKGQKLAPFEPKFYYNTAELNAGLGNFDKAIKFMNIYIKLAPNANDIQNAKDDITKWEFLQEKN